MCFTLKWVHDGNKPEVMQYKSFNMLKQRFLQNGKGMKMVKNLKYIQLSTSLSHFINPFTAS